LIFQKARSFRLGGRRPVVLATINFDDQARLVANKVGNIRPERHPIEGEGSPIAAAIVDNFRKTRRIM
jgi:non-homologous end joining protein Ku